MFQAVSLAVIVALTVIDQLTKYAAVMTVKVSGPQEFFFGLMQFRYVENTGAAFSSFAENTFVLIAVSGIILLAATVILLMRKVKSNYVNACLVLVVPELVFGENFAWNTAPWSVPPSGNIQ